MQQAIVTKPMHQRTLPCQSLVESRSCHHVHPSIRSHCMHPSYIHAASIHASTHPCINSSMRPSMQQFLHPSMHPSIHPCIHPFYPSIHTPGISALKNLQIHVHIYIHCVVLEFVSACGTSLAGWRFKDGLPGSI
jgi:hypothetical protein